MYILLELIGMMILAATLGSIVLFDVKQVVFSKIPMLKGLA